MSGSNRQFEDRVTPEEFALLGHNRKPHEISDKEAIAYAEMNGFNINGDPSNLTAFKKAMAAYEESLNSTDPDHLILRQQLDQRALQSPSPEPPLII